jgi:hypothetical protein
MASGEYLYRTIIGSDGIRFFSSPVLVKVANLSSRCLKPELRVRRPEAG